LDKDCSLHTLGLALMHTHFVMWLWAEHLADWRPQLVVVEKSVNICHTYHTILSFCKCSGMTCKLQTMQIITAQMQNWNPVSFILFSMKFVHKVHIFTLC